MTNVTRDRDGTVLALHPILIDLGGDFPQAFCLRDDTHYIGAVLRHALGNRFTDTFGRAGDDGGFAGEVGKRFMKCIPVCWMVVSQRPPRDRAIGDRLCFARR